MRQRKIWKEDIRISSFLIRVLVVLGFYLQVLVLVVALFRDFGSINWSEFYSGKRCVNQDKENMFKQPVIMMERTLRRFFC